MSANATLAAGTLGHLVAMGVKEFVVCAGARNVPLVATLLSVRERFGLRVLQHFDERTASFFALGLSRKSGDPVAVLTTSGTAAAELLPAVVEAYYSGVPLVVVTADRPRRFRGSGAPQAIEQVNLYGPYAPLTLDVADLEELLLSDLQDSWSRTEPIHLNICLAEPSPEDRATDILFPPDRGDHPAPVGVGGIEGRHAFREFLAEREGLLVLLGDLPEAWREPVATLLRGLGAPFRAEATSGLRECAALAPLHLPLESALAKAPWRKVLRIGGVPSLRFWRDLELRSEIEVFSVSRRPFPGLARASRCVVALDLAEIDLVSAAERESKSCEGTIQKGGKADPTLFDGAALEESLRSHPRSEPAMVRAISELIPSKALVFLGNSLPVREWNLAATLATPHPRCFASRGANGIDGQLATFLGMSEGEAESWGIFGDLTALCDLNAPALLPSLSRGRRRFVVINNGGGRIFSRLPSMADLAPEEKSVTENEHDRHFAPWAEMWGMEYRRWAAGEPAPEIVGDALVLEIIPGRDASEAFWEDFRR